MRKFTIAILIILAVVLIYFSLSELKSVLDTIRKSDLRFLLAALVLELLLILNMATTYRSLYGIVGLQENSRHLVLVSAAANFVNVVAPSAGIGGMAVFLDDARKRNHSTGRVTAVGALFILIDYAAFICVLVLGLIVLIRRNNLNAGEISASIALLFIALGLGSLVYLGYRSAADLGRFLVWMSRLINRLFQPFIHRNYLDEQNAHNFATEFSEGLTSIKGETKRLIWPFLFALNNKAILISIMAMTFLSFKTSFSVGTIVAGFSIGYLLLIVSPTPAGLGIVEGTLPVVLNSLRVPWEAAVLITLTYRGVTFWFPLVLGALALRILQRPVKNRQPESQGEKK